MFIQKQAKLIFIIMIFLTIVGVNTFYNTPKEDAPDVKVPVIYISAQTLGMSADNVERFVLRPIEKKLRGLQNVKKIYSNALNGYANVRVEFNAGFNSSIAFSSVKDKVTEAKPDLPAETKEPVITEVDFSKFPVLNVGLSGNLSPKELIYTARRLKNTIESIPDVLEVKIAGDRDDEISIFVNPNVFQKYKFTHQELGGIINNASKSIGAGFAQYSKSSNIIDSDVIFKVQKDIENVPLKIGKSILKLKDIGNVVRKFKNPNDIAFIDNEPAVVIEISKRYGANIIETIEQIKKVIEDEKDNIPNEAKLTFLRDSSENIKDSLEDLGNNLIFAFMLVLIIIMSQIGAKQGLIVGSSIPISFFIGILAIVLMGFTINKVVLFALILSSGMIVDASTIVAEYADRLISKNEEDNRTAYYTAAKVMAVPVLSATITTLVVYLPLLFWPGIVGQFMKYIPLTIVAVLSASIISALIFVPVLGSMFGSKTAGDSARHAKDDKFNSITEHGNILELEGFTGKYIQKLNKVIDMPKKFIIFIVTLFIISIIAYVFFGKGVSFFPSVNANNIQVVIHSAGNFNIDEKTKITDEFAKKIMNNTSHEIDNIYSKVFGDIGPQTEQYSDDVISVIDISLADWNKRRQSSVIASDISKMVSDVPSGYIEVLEEKPGPRSGEKEFQLEIMSKDQDLLERTHETMYNKIFSDPQLKDVSSNKPFNKYKFDMNFNKDKAMIYDVSLESFAGYIQMCGIGYNIAKFQPDYSEESVDINIKIPAKYCTFDAIQELEILNNNAKPVKINTITNASINKQVPLIKKINTNIALKISANPGNDINTSKKISEYSNWIKSQNFNQDVSFNFAGQTEDQKETGTFLKNAFFIAIAIKTLILIGQFNSVYYALIMMSAIILSIIGVLFGLIFTGQTFGVVMCGLGIVSLAGIVVSNNIILIDTYEKMIKNGMDVRTAILRSCAQRFRPILITSSTTIMGLIPMIFNVTINFFDWNILYNSPSGQWWEQLSTTIGFGMICATVFTLFFTPCCLILHTPDAKKA